MLRALTTIVLATMLTFFGASALAQTSENIGQHQIDLLNDEVDENAKAVSTLNARQEGIREDIGEIKTSVTRIDERLDDIPGMLAIAIFCLGIVDFLVKRYVSSPNNT